MTDQEILDLFWKREERALEETEVQYGAYCRSIAWNILQNRLDTEECVNDTWFRAWNAIPPDRPNRLAVFLGTITRNLSLDRWRLRQSKKRGGGQLETVFSELEQCVADNISLEDRISCRELSRLLDRFLQELPQKSRCIFVRRYWYADRVADIARRYGMSVSAVKVDLHRSRNKLRSELEREGYAP